MNENDFSEMVKTSSAKIKRNTNTHNKKKDVISKFL